MYGLKPHTIKAIQDVFAKHKAIEKAILYGSRAKGNYRNGSDIDLTLVGKTLTLSQLFSIETDLDDLLLPYKMDLSIFHKIENEDLIDHINRVGITFYENNNAFAKVEKKVEINRLILSANTGLDAIKRAPIVEEYTGVKCLRIQDVSQSKSFKNWGNTKVEDKNFKKFKLLKDDIIIARTGATVGVNLIIKNDLNSVFNNGLIRIRTDKTLCNSLYLYYAFQSKNFGLFMDSISGGTSTQPNIQINALLTYEVNLFSLIEQESIASTLRSLDDKIDLLNKQNRTLEALSKALFRQWLVEDGNEEWEEEPLSSIAVFLNGLACQKYPPKNAIDRLPVLKIKDLKSGISDNSDFVSTEVDEKYLVQNGDVIFSWSASLVVKIWDGEDCILNQHLFKVTSERFPKWFYYLWSKYHLDMFIAIAKAHATTMGHIKRGDLDDAMVIIPPPSVLAKMSKTFIPLIDKIIANNKQIKQVEKLRDTLLPKLMSGEVRVQI